MFTDEQIKEALLTIRETNKAGQRVDHAIELLAGSIPDTELHFPILDHLMKLVDLDILSANPDFKTDDDLEILFPIADAVDIEAYKKLRGC